MTGYQQWLRYIAVRDPKVGTLERAIAQYQLSAAEPVWPEYIHYIYRLALMVLGGLPAHRRRPRPTAMVSAHWSFI